MSYQKRSLILSHKLEIGPFFVMFQIFEKNSQILKSIYSSFAGLEEFEDKVDKIANGQDDDSWIGQIYNTFSSNFGMDGSKVGDSELGPKEGLEPPILDETWGLEDLRKLHESEDEGNSNIS